MPYENSYSGAITISPPLTRSQINDPRIARRADVKLRIVEQKVESDDGESHTVRPVADAIVPLDKDYSGDHLEDDIQLIIDTFPEHGYAGFIEAKWDAGFGEPPSRFIIKDGRVMRIDAQYRWPGIWPHEQDDSFAMVAEDAPAAPAYAIVEHWFSHAALISDSVGSPEWHAVADMTRRVLDLMDAEQDADVRAVIALLTAVRIQGVPAATKRRGERLEIRYADRIEALEARDAKDGDS
jgi:hypothetical protein